jgi:hypothetical protein
MGAKLRDALVQAAHLIADAIEAEGMPHAKTLPAVKPRPRRKRRAPSAPTGRVLSDIDRARARQIAKRAGLPIP